MTILCAIGSATDYAPWALLLCDEFPILLWAGGFGWARGPKEGVYVIIVAETLLVCNVATQTMFLIVIFRELL